MSAIFESPSESVGTKRSTQDQTLQKLEEKLSDLDPKLFEGIPKEKKKRIVKTIAVVESRIHSGPLPDPETLSRYCKVIPNGAERIMQMVEKQQDHRIELEKSVIGKQMNRSDRGRIFAFVIALISIAAAVYCVSNGHQWGAVLGVGGLTGLVSAFIQGRKQQLNDLDSKRLSLTEMS